MNEDKVRVIFDLCLKDPSVTIAILACDSQNNPVGLIVARKEELYFSDIPVAGEIIWWVDPEYRKSLVGMQLFGAFEFWAKKVDAAVCTVVNTEGTTELGKMYVRNGYHLAESVYSKEIN